MLIDYPWDWDKYFLRDGIHKRTFKKDTPSHIIAEAREINKETLRYSGSPYFFFEQDEEKPQDVLMNDIAQI